MSHRAGGRVQTSAQSMALRGPAPADQVDDAGKPESLLCVERFAAHAPRPEDVQRMCLWWAAWLKAGGQLRVENIAHLPRNRVELARAERNSHLRRAGAVLGKASPWTTAVALEKEIASFERDIWPAWRGLEAPPPDPSRARLHLFHAFKCDEDPPRTAMGLHPLFQLTKGESV